MTVTDDTPLSLNRVDDNGRYSIITKSCACLCHSNPIVFKYVMYNMNALGSNQIEFGTEAYVVELCDRVMRFLSAPTVTMIFKTLFTTLTLYLHLYA